MSGMLTYYNFSPTAMSANLLYHKHKQKTASQPRRQFILDVQAWLDSRVVIIMRSSLASMQILPITQTPRVIYIPLLTMKVCLQ
jgi:hypothetical protein